MDFWTPESAARIDGVDALMVSFGELIDRTSMLNAASRDGLRKYLGFSGKIFLDNGCFSLLREGREPPIEQYVRFVNCARPDWYPVPVDYVPSPSLSPRTARRLAEKTARINEEFGPSGYVPVIHMGPHFLEYLHRTLRTIKSEWIAIGGMVPYVRFGQGANPRRALDLLAKARSSFDGKIHVFGFGGGITSVHVMAALGIDSVDSSGWRVRAARGFILLPGQGERMLKKLGGWEGPTLTRDELSALRACKCTTCTSHGYKALTRRKRAGFERRAAHNLWVLLREVTLINEYRGRRLKEWSLDRLKNNRMRYLVEHAFHAREQQG